jgi:hypothetical protein
LKAGCLDHTNTASETLKGEVNDALKDAVTAKLGAGKKNRFLPKDDQVRSEAFKADLAETPPENKNAAGRTDRPSESPEARTHTDLTKAVDAAEFSLENKDVARTDSDSDNSNTGAFGYADTEAVLRFTRAFYSHQPLGDFPYDFLSSSQLWADGEDGCFPIQNVLPSAAAAATSMSVDRITAACVVSGNPLSDAHIRAFHQMTQAIQDKTADAIAGNYDHAAPRLSDVHASYAFQHTAREISRAHKAQKGFCKQPRQLFHKCFFAFVAGCTGTATTAAAASAGAGTAQESSQTGSSTSANSDDILPAAKIKKDGLPIDAHRDKILKSVRDNRVTVINGETGCGKSSRLPLMLLSQRINNRKSKMMVSQPHRVAAQALHKRLRSELGETDNTGIIGMRMGDNVREDSRSTRLWFVTAGYLLRLLSNQPSYFNDHTHLIVDEVHDRSIDTDMLCLFARRLVESHPFIRVVLMSATISNDLYEKYFGVSSTIFVGAKRFPIQTMYASDLGVALRFPPKLIKTCAALDTKTSTAPEPRHGLYGSYR